MYNAESVFSISTLTVRGNANKPKRRIEFKITWANLTRFLKNSKIQMRYKRYRNQMVGKNYVIILAEGKPEKHHLRCANR